ncbi:MAG: transposase [Cytophagales bacterium]|nr:transposase [Cytophagales bacterium]
MVKSSQIDQFTPTKDGEKSSRIDFYALHLVDDAHHLPSSVRYIAADGLYAKIKYLAAVRQVNLHLISKFRSDANLRYLYHGPQKKRGAKRKYDGKVKFDQLSGLDYVGEVEPGIHLYTAVVNSVSLKCNVRLVYVLNLRNKKKPSYALLFCTDTELEAETIYRYYKARCQIEFIFRDAKQFTGLCDCQARCQESLHFHFNASFTVLNLAKFDAQQTFGLDADTPFSMATQKIVYFNEHLLDQFISIFDFIPSLIKNSLGYQELRVYGAIAT